MGNYILLFALGGVAMWLIYALEVRAMRKEIQRRAERATRADETIVSYNATVMVDSRGNISWLDNDKGIKVFKAEE